MSAWEAEGCFELSITWINRKARNLLQNQLHAVLRSMILHHSTEVLHSETCITNVKIVKGCRKFRCQSECFWMYIQGHKFVRTQSLLQNIFSCLVHNLYFHFIKEKYFHKYLILHSVWLICTLMQYRFSHAWIIVDIWKWRCLIFSRK